MILRLAIRSLATRPIRTAVLACGFGFGIAVMAALLGVGEVILDQAHSPALEGGGDVVLSGRFGSIDSARFLLSSVLGAPDMAGRVVAASPSKRATLYLMTKTGAPIPVAVRAGIPSLEKAIGDSEATAADWTDRPADGAWSSPTGGEVLRAMDRFHPVPDVPEFSSSWAEWLYFNGRTADGRVRFYLTFLVGPASASSPHSRVAGVRLQLDRDGQITNYSAGGEVDATAVVQSAPDLDIAGNRVRLEGLQYRIALALPGASGDLTLDATPGRSLPPATIRGARGWVTGYTAPVLSGTIRGRLTIGRDTISIENAAGYHDHNWGFWKDVRWQWGQVAHDDLSFVYGRVFPPAAVADPDRVPGFLGVLGPHGPLGFSTNVSIEDTGTDQILVHARSQTMELSLAFTADRVVRTATGPAPRSPVGPLDFLQLGGEYRVSGQIGERALDFTAHGAAETFRSK